MHLWELLPDFRNAFSTHRERDTETGLMHYRARAYDPATGRFLQVDPVARNRPQEHYSYCGSNPVVRIDPWGAEWELKRDKGMRATVKNDDADDKIEDLSKMVRLEPGQFSNWLDVVAPKGKTLPGKASDPIGFCGEFTVPNTFVIAVGDVWAIPAGLLTVWSLRMQTALENRGFKVMYFDRHFLNSTLTYDVNTILDWVKSRNTWGFSFLGHGSKESGREGSFDWDRTWWGAARSYITPGDFVFRTASIKYGGIISYHCYANRGAWGALVSSNGTWRHSTELTSPLAGPRALGHWGSWDSLIEQMVKPKE